VCLGVCDLCGEMEGGSVENTELDAQIQVLSAQVLSESEIVQKLRAEACDAKELAARELNLKALSKSLKALHIQKGSSEANAEEIAARFDRNGVESLLKRRFFVAPAFEIYGGVGGLYDYGPPGSAAKNYLTALWREHFVVADGMLEIECSALTPAPVLKASGHVDKFADILVKDSVTSEPFRADHLLNDHLTAILENKPHPYVLAARKKKTKGKKGGGEADVSDHWIEIDGSKELEEELLSLRERLDELSLSEMEMMLEKYDCRNPETGNALGKPYEFNLMFGTSIGPAGNIPGYLRPETAQGIFVNFQRLLAFNQGKLPFAVAQIGSSFRNEISPKAGLLRVREFTQAEIEHFVAPENKDHARFSEVADLVLELYPRENQITTRTTKRMSAREAVETGVIDNQTLGYFIARTAQFVEIMGLDMRYVRFRQHLQSEMAHYASDCWDLEVRTSYGWIECAGLADRSAFDLSNHSKASGIDLCAREVFDEIRYETKRVATPNKPVLGKAFKKQAQDVMKALSEMDSDAIASLESSLNTTGKAQLAGVEVVPEMIAFETVTNALSGRNFYPSVIEPSFGIGRLLYCLFEHAYYVRPGDDEARAVLALPATIAPVKVVLLPISRNEQFDPLLREIADAFRARRIVCRTDDSGVSIGRRYARADEVGTPFGITVDFDSIKDQTVTLRERDSTKQVRATTSQVVDAVTDLISGRVVWSKLVQDPNFPAFDASAQE